MLSPRRLAARVALAVGTLSAVAATSACGDAGPETSAGTSPEAIRVSSSCPPGQYKICDPTRGICPNGMCAYDITVAENPPGPGGATCTTGIPIPQQLNGLGCTLGVQYTGVTVWACPIGTALKRPFNYAGGGGLQACALDPSPGNCPIAPVSGSPPCEASGVCSTPVCGTITPLKSPCLGPLASNWEFIVDWELQYD